MSLMNMTAEGNIYKIRREVTEALQNTDPRDVLETLVAGMHLAGERFEKGEFFLPELVRAADTFTEAMQVLEPALLDIKPQSLGKLVLGTVRGDVHDLGKNLVRVIFEGTGFEVVDLGIDVPPEVFVSAVAEHRPQFVGMSALLTTTMLQMEDVIKALDHAGLRETVRVLIGGAPVSERFAKKIGADTCAGNAFQGVRKAIDLMNQAS
jgi:5-methyltetrahydrofolate--homocysteine methyltransferase